MFLNIRHTAAMSQPIEGPDAYWTEVSRPLLDAAIALGGDIALSMRPDPNAIGVLTRADGSLTAFGREYQYLVNKGYQFDPRNGKMVAR